MQKRLVGQNHSYVFEFVEPEESENAEDFGLVFRGKCEQDGTPVIVRYLKNKQLIKSPQHLQLVQNIFLSFNKLDEGLVKTFDAAMAATAPAVPPPQTRISQLTSFISDASTFS